MNIIINGQKYTVSDGITVLEAAKECGVYIPTLCAYEGMAPKCACGLCIVDIDGKEKLACATKITEGLVITTDSEELFLKRRHIIQEMFHQHSVDCHHCLRIGSTKVKDFDPKFCRDCYFCDCVRDGFCELQQKALEFGIDELPFEIRDHDFKVDDSTGSIILNANKCIKCRRCTDVCKVQGVGILGIVNTENGKTVGAKNSLFDDGCIRCGRCADVCPTGALFMKEHIDEEIYFAHQYGVKTAALVSRDIIKPLEKLFGVKEGSFTYEQIADGLHKIGIDHVFSEDSIVKMVHNMASQMVSDMSGGKCIILTDDFAVKNYLEANFSDLKDNLLFYSNSQKIFGDYMHANYPGIKLYSISCRNSFGAEAYETKDVDYFINERELYRIFLRTGVNPARRFGTALEELFGYENAGSFNALFLSEKWDLSKEAEQTVIVENGKEYSVCICHNIGQFKKVAEDLDKYNIIKITG